MAHGIPTSTADFARKIPRYSRRYNKTASTLYRDLAQQHQKNSLTLFALRHFFYRREGAFRELVYKMDS